MKKIGIVGTGIMGAGMAENFLKTGHKVHVWNRSQDKLEALEKVGAQVAASPKAVAEACDVVFEVTANDKSSRAVWTGTEGVLAGVDAETVVIASGTFSIDWIDELASLCKQQQVTFLDIPLTGGRIAAETGTLTMLVGGDEYVLDGLRSTLEAVAQTIFHFGPAGSGMRYKLILNMLQAIHMTAFGEAMQIAEAAGMNVEKVGEALVSRPGGAVTELANTAYPKEDIPLTFSVDGITKDLTYAKQFAETLGVETVHLEDTLRAYQQTQQKGKGEEDWAVVNKN